MQPLAVQANVTAFQRDVQEATSALRDALILLDEFPPEFVVDDDSIFGGQGRLATGAHPDSILDDDVDENDMLDRREPWDFGRSVVACSTPAADLVGGCRPVASASPAYLDAMDKLLDAYELLAGQVDAGMILWTGEMQDGYAGGLPLRSFNFYFVYVVSVTARPPTPPAQGNGRSDAPRFVAASRVLHVSTDKTTLQFPSNNVVLWWLLLRLWTIGIDIYVSWISARTFSQRHTHTHSALPRLQSAGLIPLSPWRPWLASANEARRECSLSFSRRPSAQTFTFPWRTR
jgi:hypothetical protein